MCTSCKHYANINVNAMYKWCKHDTPSDTKKWDWTPRRIISEPKRKDATQGPASHSMRSGSCRWLPRHTCMSHLLVLVSRPLLRPPGRTTEYHALNSLHQHWMWGGEGFQFPCSAGGGCPIYLFPRGYWQLVCIHTIFHVYTDKSSWNLIGGWGKGVSISMSMSISISIAWALALSWALALALAVAYGYGHGHGYGSGYRLPATGYGQQAVVCR